MRDDPIRGEITSRLLKGAKPSLENPGTRWLLQRAFNQDWVTDWRRWL